MSPSVAATSGAWKVLASVGTERSGVNAGTGEATRGGINGSCVDATFGIAAIARSSNDPALSSPALRRFFEKRAAKSSESGAGWAGLTGACDELILDVCGDVVAAAFGLGHVGEDFSCGGSANDVDIGREAKGALDGDSVFDASWNVDVSAR